MIKVELILIYILVNNLSSLIEPWWIFLQNSRSCDPFGFINGQNITYQILYFSHRFYIRIAFESSNTIASVLIDLWHAVVAFLYFLEKLFFIDCSEWLVTEEHGEEDDSSCPDVWGLALVLLLGAYLWRHVCRRSAEHLHLCHWVSCESKIYDFSIEIWWIHIN